MTRKLLVSMFTAAILVGAVGRAEAVTSLSVRICQGAICQDFGPSPGPGPFTNNNITVGDFFISGQVSTQEGAGLSNAATTTIAVRRTGTTNSAQGDNLDIWLNAVDFNLPTGPNYLFSNTLGGTSSAAPAGVTVSFQGWFNDANTTGFPPAGSVSPGSISCALLAGTDSCNAPTASLAVTGNPAFGMTTRTRFTIANANADATYTSNAQANVVPTAVPEPGSMLLLGSGLVGLGSAVRRRMKKSKA